MASARGPERDQIAAAIARVRGRLADRALSSVKDATSSAKSIPDWEAIARKLRSEVSYDDAGRRISQALADAERQIGRLRERRAALDSAAAAADAAGDWASALKSLTEAQVIAGNLEDLGGRIAALLQKRDATVLAQFRESIMKRDAAGARLRLQEWMGMTPPPPARQLESASADLLKLTRTLFLEDQEKLIASQKYFTVFRTLEKSDRFAEADAMMERVRKEGSAHYLSTARREVEAGTERIGYAYIAASKAKILDPEREDVFALHRDLSDAMEAFITIKIAVAGFESPAQSPGLGGQVSDALITYLVDNLPYGIKVLERESIDRARNSTDMNLATIAKELGVEMIITGNVSSLSVERKRFEREVTELVKVGMQRSPNPLYAKMMEKHGPDTSKWPQQVSEMIDVAPITEKVAYKLGDETLNGVMVAYVRSFETARGVISQSREFSAVANHKDTFRDAVPAANVTYDPLELPTDNEVREKLRSDLVSQIATEALKAYAGRERRYLAEAKNSLTRREPVLAVLHLAAALHFARVAPNAVEGDASKAALKEIDQLAYFDLTEL